MKTISVEATVGEIVRAEPGTSRVFEKLGIDYCCGGKLPLKAVCQAKSLDSNTVISMLGSLESVSGEILPDPDAMTLGGLCDHIEQVHHNYLREELPRLDLMTRKVASVHGEQEPRLLELRQAFEVFQDEIVSHINAEEYSIFPMIPKLGEKNECNIMDTVMFRESIAKLENEHTSAGEVLQKFRNLTDHYSPPDWACNTFRALYDGLEKLEQNMHQHVHKENNILFPKVSSILAQYEI